MEALKRTVVLDLSFLGHAEEILQSALEFVLRAQCLAALMVNLFTLFGQLAFPIIHEGLSILFSVVSRFVCTRLLSKELDLLDSSSHRLHGEFGPLFVLKAACHLAEVPRLQVTPCCHVLCYIGEVLVQDGPFVHVE